MDKSRMTFTFRPRKDSPSTQREWRDVRPFDYAPRKERVRKFRSNDEKDSQRVFAGLSWLMPAALAALTGLTLGFGVLFLFKHAASGSEPTVTTVNPPPQKQHAEQSSLQTLPGLNLFAYQVASYQDYERAKKGAAEFEKFGIRPVLRNADRVQLYVGVASTKEQGQAIVDSLKQNASTADATPPLYVKEYRIAERKGSIAGLPAKDAATISGTLSVAVQVMKDGISLAIEKQPAKEQVEAWNKRVQSLSGMMETARKSLETAGRKGELARLDDMMQQLQEAGSVMIQGKGVLEAQRPLVQCVVDYEELAGKLIPDAAP